MYAARGALPPLAPHFYPLSALRATSPEGGSEACFYRLCEEAKRRSKLPGGWVSAKYIIFTLVVGYFAYAQYDVCFFTVFARKQSDEANSREGGFSQSIYFSLWSWDISLALNMTCVFFACHCEGAKRPRQSLGVKCGVYVAYFFRGIATLTLAMTREFYRATAFVRS